MGCTFSPSEKPVQEQVAHEQTEEFRISPDVVYGHKFGLALTLDVYQPRQRNGAAIIFVNSGGWVSWIPNFFEQTAEGLRLLTDEELTKMNPILHQISFRPLLAKGFTIFAVRHGSSPKFQMSEIVADLHRAVRFIRFHAEKYGVDADRLGLWGGSAGGHLSILLGTTADIEIPDASEEFEKYQGRVRAVVAYFPPSDLQRLYDNWSPDVRERFPAMWMQEEEYKQYSPLFFASSDDPPTLIIHGDQDDLVPVIEGESMHQALLKSGVKSRFVKIPGAGHGFSEEEADSATAEMLKWFETHLISKQ